MGLAKKTETQRGDLHGKNLEHAKTPQNLYSQSSLQGKAVPQQRLQCFYTPMFCFFKTSAICVQTVKIFPQGIVDVPALTPPPATRWHPLFIALERDPPLPLDTPLNSELGNVSSVLLAA